MGPCGRKTVVVQALDTSADVTRQVSKQAISGVLAAYNLTTLPPSTQTSIIQLLGYAQLCSDRITG